MTGAGEEQPVIDEPTPDAAASERAMPPFVILEHLVIGGFETVRVAGITQDEGKAHDIASAMADVGLHVWFADLWGDGEGPRISRYVGAPGAAYLHSHGIESTSPGAGAELTERGL